MDITAELIRLFGLKSTSQICQGDEMFGQGGYLSFRRAATITKNVSEELHVFIKISDVSRLELTEMQTMSSYFCRTECVFYGLMAPVLERVMIQYEIEPPYPKVFGQRISDKGTILVMEDMTKDGFSLIDRSSFSIDMVYCVVKALSGLQAAYWIARTSFNNSLDSVLFGENGPFSDNVRKSGVNWAPLMPSRVTYFFENFSKFTRSTEDEVIIREYVSSFLKEMMADPMKSWPSMTDKPAGLSHGDLWFTNLMFKGEGDTLTCRLFDWQFWDINIFGFDLGLLMFTCLSAEEFEQHVENIPVMFYRTFKEIYEAKTGNPAPFSEEAALDNMQHIFFFALFWVVVTGGLMWETCQIDVPSLISNLAFTIRTNRITVPF